MEVRHSNKCATAFSAPKDHAFYGKWANIFVPPRSSTVASGGVDPRRLESLKRNFRRRRLTAPLAGANLIVCR